jgi:hypothetical protein
LTHVGGLLLYFLFSCYYSWALLLTCPCPCPLQ